MRLRNKKTGEIGKLHCDMNVSPAKYGVFEDTDIRGHYWEYGSLAELNEGWEDYNEPDKFWFIQAEGAVDYFHVDDDSAFDKGCKSVGNYFDTKEEAEKAVEKLKAWKRLRDKGFRFDGYDSGHNSNKELCGQAYFKAGNFWFDIKPDLDLLFGGEE